MRPQIVGNETYQDIFEGVVQLYIHLGERFPQVSSDSGVRYVLEGAIRQNVTREPARRTKLLPHLLGRERRRHQAASLPPMALHLRTASRLSGEPAPRLVGKKERAARLPRRGR